MRLVENMSEQYKNVFTRKEKQENIIGSLRDTIKVCCPHILISGWKEVV